MRRGGRRKTGATPETFPVSCPPFFMAWFGIWGKSGTSLLHITGLLVPFVYFFQTCTHIIFEKLFFLHMCAGALDTRLVNICNSLNTLDEHEHVNKMTRLWLGVNMS